MITICFSFFHIFISFSFCVNFFRVFFSSFFLVKWFGYRQRKRQNNKTKQKKLFTTPHVHHETNHLSDWLVGRLYTFDDAIDDGEGSRTKKERKKERAATIAEQAAAAACAPFGQRARLLRMAMDRRYAMRSPHTNTPQYTCCRFLGAAHTTHFIVCFARTHARRTSRARVCNVYIYRNGRCVCLCLMHVYCFATVDERTLEVSRLRTVVRNRYVLCDELHAVHSAQVFWTSSLIGIFRSRSLFFFPSSLLHTCVWCARLCAAIDKCRYRIGG